MIKNFLKVAFRNLLRNKTFSFINIFGLTVGTLCCLYILLYVKDQYSYDKHHANAKDIYRVTSFFQSKGDKSNTMATTSPPVALAMKNDFKKVEQYTRVVSPPGVSQHLFQFKDKSFYVTKGLFVDSTFFQVFSYKFIFGSPYKALQEPYTIVLSEETAAKLFGKTDPVGQVVQIDNSFGKNDFKVTGVVNNSLGRTHLTANFFVSMNSGGIGEYVRTDDSWAGNNFVSAYVKLIPGTNAIAFANKLPAFLNKYGAQQLKEHGMSKVLRLQPVTSIHTTIGYNADLAKPIDPTFLYILLFIAGLIQIIACINFMNLSTARSYNRAKEVGVRKSIGASRFNLIKQFLTESVLLTVLSILIAIPLLWLVLPALNQLTRSDIKFSTFYQKDVALIVLVLVVITGLLAGSYPAFYLSGFKVVRVLKGNLNSTISGISLRKGLVVFQFVLSVVLIVGIIVINRQLDFINTKDIGFDKSQKIILGFKTDDAKKQMSAVQSELQQLSEVKNITLANNYPSQFVFNDVSLTLPGQDATDAKDVQFMMTNEGFIKTLGIKLQSGRDLTNFDSGRILINEAAIKQLSIEPAKALGTILYGNDKSFEIVGVMKDFNFSSLRDEIKPFMLMNPPHSNAKFLSNMIIAVHTKNYQVFLKKISSIWRSALPSAPFEYTFLDDEMQKQYESETILSGIINAFTLIAIIISCLGLFGLAAFTAERRTKEIGIRKVLGASVSGIVGLLSKDFLKLVIISVVIASPIAWYAMNKWLNDFAYRINIGWWVFGLAGLIAMVIAFITVSFQAIKAAIANPVNSLRSE